MKIYNAHGRYRLLAEWEEECAILMAWPAEHTDWAYMLPQARQQCLALVTAMLNAGQRVILLVAPGCEFTLVHPLLRVVVAEYNDTWTRDYGPISAGNGND